MRPYGLVVRQRGFGIWPSHDRMPVILPVADYGAWLDPTCSDARALQAMLRPYKTEAMACYPVLP
jgi:putative SOS response-associated peptidase YedK